MNDVKCVLFILFCEVVVVCIVFLIGKGYLIIALAFISATHFPFATYHYDINIQQNNNL